MHMEFARNDWEALELQIMATDAQINRGILLEKALENNGITKETYYKNVEKVYNTLPKLPDGLAFKNGKLVSI